MDDLAMMNNLLLSIYDYVLTPYQSDHLSAELLQYQDEIAEEMMASPGCLIACDESNLIRYRPRTAVRKSVFRREEEIFEV